VYNALAPALGPAGVVTCLQLCAVGGAGTLSRNVLYHFALRVDGIGCDVFCVERFSCQQAESRREEEGVRTRSISYYFLISHTCILIIVYCSFRHSSIARRSVTMLLLRPRKGSGTVPEVQPNAMAGLYESPHMNHANHSPKSR